MGIEPDTNLALSGHFREPVADRQRVTDFMPEVINQNGEVLAGECFNEHFRSPQG